MAAIFLSEYARRKNFYADLYGFLVQNEVLTIATGVVVGVATSTFVRHATFDVVMPVINLLFFGLIKFVHKPTGLWLSRLLANSKFKWVHFVQESVMWVFVLIVAFLLIQYGLLKIAKKLLLEAESVKQEDEKDIKSVAKSDKSE